MRWLLSFRFQTLKPEKVNFILILDLERSRIVGRARTGHDGRRSASRAATREGQGRDGSRVGFGFGAVVLNRREHALSTSQRQSRALAARNAF